MQLKSSAFQLAIVWVVISLLVTACGGTSTNCDDPNTAEVEVCGTSSHSTGGYSGVYYRSGGSSYVRGATGGSGVSRTGFGRTGSGRSGFG
jgi:hypothetical protein